jgi:hypothetical protein
LSSPITVLGDQSLCLAQRATLQGQRRGTPMQDGPSRFLGKVAGNEVSGLSFMVEGLVKALSGHRDIAAMAGRFCFIHQAHPPHEVLSLDSSLHHLGPWGSELHHYHISRQRQIVRLPGLSHPGLDPAAARLEYS